MAVPYAAIGLGLQIGGAILGSRSAKKQARKQREAAFKNYQFELSSLFETSKEVNLKAGEEMSERARQAMFQRSRLAVIGAESGIEGNTQDRLERQTYFDEGFDLTMIDENRQRAQSQIEREKEGARIRMESTSAGVSVPSGLAAGLQIVGNIMDLASKTPSRKPSIP